MSLIAQSHEQKPALGPRKDSDFVDVDLPMKEELLFDDHELDFKEFEDYVLINGKKL